MSGSQAIISIFDSSSKSEQSDIFQLLPGWIAEIKSFGFQTTWVKSDPDTSKHLQAACLYQVMLKDTPLINIPDGCGMTVIIPKKNEDILAEGPVVVDGCQVHVSACDTQTFITWPGLYRFVLNDPGALGNVQVYLLAYPKNALGL
jgi:hypothetical protein